MLAELHALASCIHRARRDLFELRADDIVDRHVPVASDELDAVVTHTAAATGAIMDECEALEQAVAETACHALVSAAAGRIYEACSFQDITGQRVAKVVHTLQLVDMRVASILRVFGHIPTPDAPPEEAVALLNGPQAPHRAMDQSAVDALLASFE